MSDMNCFCFTGRLTDDAKLSKKDDAHSILTFSVAVNRYYKPKNSEEWINKPTFLPLAIFDKKAEGLFPYLKKGVCIAVSSHIGSDEWEKDGEKRKNLRVCIDELHLTGSVGSRKEKELSGDIEPESFADEALRSC
jgi:single-strand DNA-binding protein